MQKTAYERRISDWNSDVCSSDLLNEGADHGCFALLQLRRATLHSRAGRKCGRSGCGYGSAPGSEYDCLGGPWVRYWLGYFRRSGADPLALRLNPPPVRIEPPPEPAQRTS